MPSRVLADDCPMTLITFLSYLLKFLSNPALLAALISMIQKFLRLGGL
jgi:hypothetical protein